MTTIVLADDHDLVRECIASLLSDVPNFQIVGQCHDGRELVDLVERHRPNVVLVDISMAELNGIEAAKRIGKISPRTRIIALSAHKGEDFIRAMLNAGASGYVVKSSAVRDLVEAIRSGSRGKVYFSREIRDVGRKIQSQTAPGKNGWAFPKQSLTAREREILQLIGEGASSVEIAGKLRIGETTVKSHRKHIMDKLDVRDVAGLTRQAIRLKLVYVE